jgi:AcrR family transcriptional regulator
MTATGERTRRLLAATCRVVGRKGAHALRMADVAREAGVSNALLHYYFETRTELLIQAFAYAEERAYARTDAVLETLPTGAERLRRLLLLYVDDEPVFHEDWVLWNEVWSSALFDQELRPAIEAGYADWVGRVAELAREAREDGSVSRDVDVEAAARRLAALVDGLGSQRLVGLITPSEAAQLVEDALELELGLRRAQES